MVTPLGSSKKSKRSSGFYSPKSKHNSLVYQSQLSNEEGSAYVIEAKTIDKISTNLSKLCSQLDLSDEEDMDIGKMKLNVMYSASAQKTTKSKVSIATKAAKNFAASQKKQAVTNFQS